MAILIKKAISKWIQFKARKPLAVEDNLHESEISTGEVFAIRVLRNQLQLVDGEGKEFFAYNVSAREVRSILNNSERVLKQSIDVKSAWQIVKTIYFPKLKVPKFSDMDKDSATAGYWSIGTRTLALDFSEPDWIGNLIHEMCHQELEEVRKVKQEHTHDKHFQKLAVETNAKIYDLASEVASQLESIGGKFTPLDMSKGILPKYMITVDGGEVLVGATILYDSNLTVYIILDDGNIVQVHTSGQFVARKSDIAKFKKNFKGNLNKALVSGKKSVLAHLERNS